MINKNKSPLGLYIHWPFCVSKCPYCDFNSHVRATIDESDWQQAYMMELERQHAQTSGRKLTSIFFGGGTPSLMNPKTTEMILRKAQDLWGFEEGIEITLEANPNSVEVSKFASLAQAGINRVSIGIQSLNPEDLKFLERQHSVEEGLRAIETAQNHFSRVSFDLIYARPNQSTGAWEKELRQALEFNTEHLSLYQLTIEPGTAFATRYARGDFVLPNEDEAADLYLLTRDLCAEKGLYDYEVSNYARPTAESRHNLVYWHYDDYAGVGPGAHGRVTLANGSRVATKQYRAPETWLRRVAEDSGCEEEIPLSLEEQSTEMLLMGLRLREPFDLNKLPLPWSQIIDEHQLALLQSNNFLSLDNSSLTLHDSARLCLNEVLQKLRR